MFSIKFKKFSIKFQGFEKIMNKKRIIQAKMQFCVKKDKKVGRHFAPDFFQRE